jgi:polyphosphate kinase 2 (PPK2 family)
MDGQLRFVHELVEPLAVPPGRRVRLRHDFDPGYTDALASKPEAGERLSEGVALLADYQERLAAQDTYAVLLVVQGLDASGKDSTIKHVTSGVNPQGVQVHSFKQPSPEELDHDFLWRYQRFLPPRGGIGIYNRSHYEEVLVVRVHPELLDAEHLPPESRAGDIWERRFREFSIADIREREHWDDYQKAYEQMLSHTSTEWAPWYVVPADHKWFARLATAAILIRALAEIDPQYPRPAPEMLQQMAEARALLEAETEADGSGSTGRTRGRDAASEG